MKQTEKERVFLVKNLPSDLNDYSPMAISVGDFFDSNCSDALKIRQRGDRYQLIKKETQNAHERVEHTIDIKEGEYKALVGCVIQFHRKNRYFYKLGKHIVEIDYYLDRLDGYVRAEIEFENDSQMHDFQPPEWFSSEITEINHEIHEDLGLVTFDQMKERYHKRGIVLNKVSLY